MAEANVLFQHAIVAAGPVPVLAQLVGSADSVLRLAVMEALDLLMGDPDLHARPALVAAGGPQPLLRRLASSEASEEEQVLAAGLAAALMNAQDDAKAAAASGAPACILHASVAAHEPCRDSIDRVRRFALLLLLPLLLGGAAWAANGPAAPPGDALGGAACGRRHMHTG